LFSSGDSWIIVSNVGLTEGVYALKLSFFIYFINLTGLIKQWGSLGLVNSVSDCFGLFLVHDNGEWTSRLLV
jgi:hypothetical protein